MLMAIPIDENKIITKMV